MITKEDFTFCGNEAPEEARPDRRQVSRGRIILRKMLEDRKTMAGLIIVLVLVLLSLIGPLFSRHSESEIITATVNGKAVTAGAIPPTLRIDPEDPKNGAFGGETFLFGTDDLGRDLWVRTWTGTRVSLLIALVSILIDVAFGMSYGLISGFFGGKTDMIMQRVTEIVKSVPRLVVVSVLAVFMKKGMGLVIVSLALTAWITMSQIARAEVMRIRNLEYIMASRTLGAGKLRIIFSDILPNTRGAVLSQVLISIPGAIFTEAFLSFVGVGILPPRCSIGSLVQSGFNNIIAIPHMMIPPIILLALLMFGFSLLGDGLMKILSEN